MNVASGVRPGALCVPGEHRLGMCPKGILADVSANSATKYIYKAGMCVFVIIDSTHNIMHDLSHTIYIKCISIRISDVHQWGEVNLMVF